MCSAIVRGRLGLAPLNAKGMRPEEVECMRSDPFPTSQHPRRAMTLWNLFPGPELRRDHSRTAGSRYLHISRCDLLLSAPAVSNLLKADGSFSSQLCSHEFEWKREECFILRKPDPSVLVAVTKEPPGRIKTSSIQILDYNLNRFVPASLTSPCVRKI